MPASERSLERLYGQRFSDEDLKFRRASAGILCRAMFDDYVSMSGTVLDLGAGTCEFANAIRARRKLAIDLRADLGRFTTNCFGVISSALELPIADAAVDLVFASNFLEHLPARSLVLDTLRECHRVLKEGGRIVVLMPNARYVGHRFWDYLDHHTPLTHISLVEALRTAYFEPVRVTPRFLPYTINARWIPRAPGLLKLYLRLPPLWYLLGKQMLVVARPLAA